MHRLSHHAPLAAAALAAVAAGLWLVLAPPTPDLAAQVYRTGLFRQEGFTLFNAQWYGGHHTPGYSLLFPPLAALVGPRVLGAIAAVASAALFAALARRHFGPKADPGIAWFALATATDLFIGRLTFGFGVAFGLAALLAVQRGHPRVAVALAVATTAASPVSGLFLALAGVALWLARRSSLVGLWVAAGAFAPAVALAVLFPEGGVQPWGARSFIALLAATAVVAWLLPRSERVLRTGALLYAAAAVAAFVIATPMGSNATRLGALFAGPLLLCALRARGLEAPRVRPQVVALAGAALLAWQWYAPVRETGKGLTDPSHQASFYAGLLDRLEGEASAARIEIPFTRMHWESVHVARKIALARGWETQLDVKYNGIFRRPGALTAERYQHWLKTHGVRYVALPEVPLDPAAEAEAAIIRRGLPYLEQVWADRHWTLFRVRGARELAGDGGRVRRLGPSSFTLEASRPGPVTVRVRHTPYWTITRGSGCVERGPDGWTVVRAARPGTITVSARFDPARVLSRAPRCAPR